MKYLGLSVQLLKDFLLKHLDFLLLNIEELLLVLLVLLNVV